MIDVERMDDILTATRCVDEAPVAVGAAVATLRDLEVALRQTEGE